MTSCEPPRVVTDSTADIPAAMARRLDIAVVPCQIHVQGRTYLDGVDISRQELFAHMRSGDLITTSQPPVGVFAEAYHQALAERSQVVAIHLGAAFSGLHDTACVAARDVDPARITVVDSQQVSMCLGWLVVQAAEMAQQGRGRSEIVAHVRQMIPRLRLFALIDDLRFLYRGGRVGAISAMVGQLLSIKPVVQVRQGRVDVVAKVRSFARGLEHLRQMAEGLGALERLAVLHADAAEAATGLAGQLARLVPEGQLLTTEAGAIISAHAGPGAVGFACAIRA